MSRTRESGREKHPRHGGKRQEGKEAEDLQAGIVSEKGPWEQRPEDSEGAPCHLQGNSVPGKGAAKALTQMSAHSRNSKKGTVPESDVANEKPRRYLRGRPAPPLILPWLLSLPLDCGSALWPPEGAERQSFPHGGLCVRHRVGRGLRTGSTPLSRVNRQEERGGWAEAVRRRPEQFGQRTGRRWRRSGRRR